MGIFAQHVVFVFFFIKCFQSQIMILMSKSNSLLLNEL